MRLYFLDAIKRGVDTVRGGDRRTWRTQCHKARLLAYFHRASLWSCGEDFIRHDTEFRGRSALFCSPRVQGIGCLVGFS